MSETTTGSGSYTIMMYGSTGAELSSYDYLANQPEWALAA